MGRDPGGESLDPGVLHGLIGFHLRRASGEVAADFKGALAGTGLRQVPFAVLAVVAANPGAAQGSVGRALGVKRANVAALVGELVDAGLLERRPSAHDRRTIALTLTDEGAARFGEWTDRILRHEERLFQRFSPDERAVLLALLRRIPDGG